MFVCLFVPFFSSSASTISGSGIQRHQDISGCAVGQAQGWPGAPWLLHLLPGDGHRGMANSQQQTSDMPAVSAALLCSGTTLHSSAPAWSRVSVKKRTSSVPTHRLAPTPAAPGPPAGSGLLQGWFVQPELAAEAVSSAQAAPQSLRHLQIHIPWLCLCSSRVSVNQCRIYSHSPALSHVKQKKSIKNPVYLPANGDSI